MSNNLTSKKVWSVEERQEMMEYITLEYPKFSKSKVADICKLMEKLAIPLEEAIELMEFDKNPQDLDTKQKATKEIKKMTAQAKKELKAKKSEQKAKADKVKTDVMSSILELLQDMTKNPELVKNGQICFRGLDDQFYTLKLTKNKNCPDGYSDGK